MTKQYLSVSQRQVANQRFCHSIGQVFDIRITALVDESLVVHCGMP